MKVGFIGLGVMGLPMARNLVEKGHDVTVASRSHGPVDRAVAFGATDGGDPAAVAAASDVVLMCVPDSPDVVAVVDALLPALSDRHVVVDCSTIDPDVERAQHERVAATGANYLEAPVSGGSAGAEKGTLTLMVGGDAAALATARPALEAVSALIVHVGGPGTGQVVKIANNLIYAATFHAVAEGFTMAAKSGVDLHKAYEVITHSSGDSVAVRRGVPFEGLVPDGPASQDWRPGFMTDLMAKDVDLAIAYAARIGVQMQTGALARTLLTAAQEAGYGRDDFAASGKVVRSVAGV